MLRFAVGYVTKNTWALVCKLALNAVKRGAMTYGKGYEVAKRKKRKECEEKNKERREG